MSTMEKARKIPRFLDCTVERMAVPSERARDARAGGGLEWE